jgi:hypothetical protein
MTDLSGTTTYVTASSKKSFSETIGELLANWGKNRQAAKDARALEKARHPTELEFRISFAKSSRCSCGGTTFCRRCEHLVMDMYHADTRL